MLFILNQLLSAEQVKGLREQIQAASFSDGALTANGLAKAVKRNEQLNAQRAPELIRSLTSQIVKHPRIKALALPAKATPVMISRYRQGMAYGVHSDSAQVQGVRTDLSYTLFLEDPNLYEGGALLIQSPVGNQRIRLPAGSLVLYNTGTLHSVEPVTAGERLAAVGWIQSQVRDPRQRELLWDLERARVEYKSVSGHDHAAQLLNKVSQNLRRLWLE